MSDPMQQAERAERLARVNAVLREHNLKELRSLGDHTNGQIELVEIVDVFDHSARFFTDVQFSCLFPNGNEGRFTIRWNANSAVSDGAVMVVTINGNIAVVRQYRPALGTWMTELPRGFGESLDNAQVNGQLGTLQIADLPIATALRELGEEVVASARVVSVTHLGNIAENSGTHANTPAYWAIEIEVDPETLRRRRAEVSEEGLALQTWTYDRAMNAIGGALADSHTITGLALYRNHVERTVAMRQA
ncbi:MAG TPA: hypothetical protein VHQ86_01285 [Candidatus Saccharimonadia bacterium]|jgi:hypothetical protein|nr:hypothetical protein [Candidatus Saccharimonadia bacterium]